MGRADRYVNQIALSGEYVDGNGRHYVFGRDGIASFPGRKFKYTIGIDHVENQFDYIEDQADHQIFSFKRTNENLEIFHTSGPINQGVEKTPFLSLHLWHR